MSKVYSQAARLDGELTEAQYELADKIAATLTELQDTIPSAVARKVHCTTREAFDLLEWMVKNHLALVTGNGLRSRYQPWDRSEWRH